MVEDLPKMELTVSMLILAVLASTGCRQARTHCMHPRMHMCLLELSLYVLELMVCVLLDLHMCWPKLSVCKS